MRSCREDVVKQKNGGGLIRRWNVKALSIPERNSDLHNVQMKQEHLHLLQFLEHGCLSLNYRLHSSISIMGYQFAIFAKEIGHL